MLLPVWKYACHAYMPMYEAISLLSPYCMFSLLGDLCTSKQDMRCSSPASPPHIVGLRNEGAFKGRVIYSYVDT